MHWKKDIINFFSLFAFFIYNFLLIVCFCVCVCLCLFVFVSLYNVNCSPVMLQFKFDSALTMLPSSGETVCGKLTGACLTRRELLGLSEKIPALEIFWWEHNWRGESKCPPHNIHTESVSFRSVGSTVTHLSLCCSASNLQFTNVPLSSLGLPYQAFTPVHVTFIALISVCLSQLVFLWLCVYDLVYSFVVL